MNFEHLETIRTEAIEASLKALTGILIDDKADIESRLKAAKLIDGISDTMVSAYLLSEVTKTDASTKDKLLKGLDKLHGHDE